MGYVKGSIFTSIYFVYVSLCISLWRPEVYAGVFLYHSPPPFGQGLGWRQGPSLKLKFIHPNKLAREKGPGISLCPCLPSTGLFKHIMPGFFCVWILGIWTQVLMLVRASISLTEPISPALHLFLLTIKISHRGLGFVPLLELTFQIYLLTHSCFSKSNTGQRDL